MQPEFEAYLARRHRGRLEQGPRFFPSRPRLARFAVDLSWLGEEPWTAETPGLRVTVGTCFCGMFAVSFRDDPVQPMIRALQGQAAPAGFGMGGWAPNRFEAQRTRLPTEWTAWTLRRWVDRVLRADLPSVPVGRAEEHLDGSQWILEASDGHRLVRLHRWTGAPRAQTLVAARAARVLVSAAGRGPWSCWTPAMGA